MPPEPLPWDRKDFFKERRHERPPSDSVGPASRWRGLAPHNGFRGRPPGNGRPGAWRYNSAESGRGFPPSRVSEKFFGDEGFRPSGYRTDGRHNRTNWDAKGSFGQKDFRGQLRGNGMMQNSYERLHADSDRRSVDSDHRSVDDKGCFGQRDPKGQFWGNAELQNSSGRLHSGIDQRSFDDKGSFARKDWRGKSWENGSYPTGSGRVQVGENQSSVNGKGSYDVKDLKGYSWENGVLPNGSGKADAEKDHGSHDDNGSFSQTVFRGKSCENGVLPNSSSRLHVGSHQSPVHDKRSFCPKNIKRNSTENGALPNRSGRLHVGDDQGPVGDTLTFTTLAHSDSARPQDARDSKDQHDKPSSANDLGPGRWFEKENSFGSIDWKPLKWTRLGSFSARASGSSHSSCTKSTDSNEPKALIPPDNATPVRSPSGNAAAAACVTMSVVSFEDTGSRKKPRLRWGEGLAKVAKKKVEGHDDDSTMKPGLIVSVGTEHSHVSNVANKSPRVAGFLDCASPATPSLVACSSSPGDEDKACSRSAKMDHDTNYVGGSPNFLPQDNGEGTQEWDFCLENLETSSVANLCWSPTKLFLVDNPAVVNSSCERSTAMIKLLAQKGETLKALEVTESEIDLLETDLKKLISDSGYNCPHPATSSSLPGDCHAKPCENIVGFNAIPQHSPLRVISSEEVEKAGGLSGEDHGHIRDDILGPTISKFAEPFAEVKDGVSSDLVKNDESCDDMVVELLGNLEKGQEFGSSGRKIEGLSGSKGGGASLSSDKEEALRLQILASNKDTAVRANELFDKLLPSNYCSIDASRLNTVTSWKDDPWIMEKFAYRKFCRRFQERVNILKFRALHHLWKEDLRLLSVKKKHAKIQKRLELCLRLPHSSNQKHRSSRSRFSSAAGALVPSAKVVNFARKLLSDSQVKAYRNVLKMPALIVDKERITSRFISNNGLVEDACAFEKERAMINPWTKEEQDIFMDKLAVFGKDFKKISSFLDHKTTADCVEFYYKNHKSDCFVKLKKKPDFPKQGKSSLNNYLLTSGKRWNRETNAASLDVLGEALAVACKADYAMKTLPEISGHKSPRNNALTERPHDLDVSANERETEAADVLAGICGSISSEAMSSCITSSFDRGESYRDLMNQKVSSDDETSSDDSCGEIEPTHWTDEEKSILIQAVSSYGTDFAMISRRVGTKSRDQCKVFFSKARKCLGLDTLHPRPCGEGIPCEDDNNGGGSDSEVACVMETDSVVCSEKSTYERNKDVLLSGLDMNGLAINDCEAPDDAGKISSDDLMEEDKPEVGVEGDAKWEDDVDNEPLIARDPMINVLPLDAEEDRGAGEVVSSVGSVSAEVVNDHGSSVSCAEVGMVDPVRGSGEPPEDHQEMISGNNSTDKQDGNDLNDKQDTNRNSLSNLNCDVQDLHDGGYELNLAADSDAVTESGISHKQDKKITLNLNPPLESLSISMGGDDCPVNGVSVGKGVPSSTHVDFERITDKLCNESASADIYTQCQPSPSAFVQHPLQVATNLKVEGDYCSMYGLRECFLWKCNGGSNSQGSAVELPFHSHAQKISHSRHHSGSSPDTERPNRNGDVKLFGQILTHSPSQPEQSNENVPDNGDKGAQHPKPITKNVNQKLTSTNILDSTSVIGTTDRNNYLCLENFPSRSFGFWDGNKMQTGFTSFPNPDILLAKYPAAFGNFSSASNIEQQQALNSVVKSNDHKLNGVSVFTPRERQSGNGLVDYQSYRNQQDKISEMQRQTGTGAFTSLQNSIGVVGTNVAISDPVAAIKMHYAKVEQYGGQTGSIMLEEESWRGKAVGR